MREIVVLRLNRKIDYVCEEKHVIPFPEVGDPGFYRLTLSMSAFFRTDKARSWTETYAFVLRHPNQFSISVAAMKATQHTDLLSFFRHIGYERKTKKFIQHGKSD